MESAPPASLADLRVPTEPRFEAHRAAFEARFGAGECRLFFAPGRVNLMGAHLDYNGGPVMPMAIDRGTFVAVRPREDDQVRLASSSESGEASFDMAALGGTFPQATGSWWDYPMGVLRALEPGRDALAKSRGLDVYFGGDLPVGAGLSSSASVTLASAAAFAGHFGLDLDIQGAVDASLDAEREYVGVQCGIMDPYAVGHARPGHILLLDCVTRTTQHAQLDGSRYTIGIVDTGVRRELARGEFNQRVEECSEAFRLLSPFAPAAGNLSSVPLEVLDANEAKLPGPVARRARHVIEETARTFASRDALLAGNVPGFGAGMFAAHTSLRDLFEVSIPELDLLVEIVKTVPGVLGSRLTGAGFGGCIVVVLETGNEAALESAVTQGFEAQFQHKPQVAFYRGSPGLGEII